MSEYELKYCWVCGELTSHERLAHENYWRCLEHSEEEGDDYE